MGGRNMCRRSLKRATLDEQPIGTRVIDGDMDVYTRRDDGKWVPDAYGPAITTLTLHQNGPVRIWPYANKAGARP